MTELFNKLSKINVNDKVEKKGNLSYLSWAFAVEEISKACPDFTYSIHMFEDNNGNQLPYMYDERTGYMVMTSITIDKQTKTMWLPVMDFKNKSNMDAKMTDINKTLMRCLTKNIAMFGLGLYIYAGEDLPDANTEVSKPATQPKVEVKPNKEQATLSSMSVEANLKAINEAKYVEELSELYKGWKDLQGMDSDAYNKLLRATKAKKQSEGWK